MTAAAATAAAGAPRALDALQRARALVLAHGFAATSYQILNPGITRWFAAAGDAVVGYVRHGRSRVVAGAPVCSAGRLPAVVAEFERDAATARQHVCYFGAESRLAQLCADRGAEGRAERTHARVLLGAQPAWHPRTFAATLQQKPSLRAQLHRARNKGIVVREASAALVSGDLGLQRCLAEWLATRKLPPLHFLVEPETLGRVLDRRVFVAARQGREPVAFLVASPVPGRRGWLIEQIVRGRAAPNGTAELLLAHAAHAVAADGAEYFTLGLSPLSRRGGVPAHGDPAWLRLVLGWVRAHGRRFYDFEGLDAWKAKFVPERWEPVHAIAAGRRCPPRALWAIAGAFSRGSPLVLAARGAWRAAGAELARLRR